MSPVSGSICFVPIRRQRALRRLLRTDLFYGYFCSCDFPTLDNKIIYCCYRVRRPVTLLCKFSARRCRSFSCRRVASVSVYSASSLTGYRSRISRFSTWSCSSYRSCGAMRCLRMCQIFVLLVRRSSRSQMNNKKKLQTRKRDLEKTARGTKKEKKRKTPEELRHTVERTESNRSTKHKATQLRRV